MGFFIPKMTQLQARIQDSIKHLKVFLENVCCALYDLVPFVQFKKREKHPRRSVTSFQQEIHPMNTYSSIRHRFDIENSASNIRRYFIDYDRQICVKRWHRFDVRNSTSIRLPKSTKYQWVLHVVFSMSFRCWINVTVKLLGWR